MHIKLMSDFIHKPVSRSRLTEAFGQACGELAEWCDNPRHCLSRANLLDQFSETWRTALELRLPTAPCKGEVKRWQRRDQVLFRVNQELEALEVPSPSAIIVTKVLCRRIGDGPDWRCRVVAKIREAGKCGLSFYDGDIDATLWL
jgi:hypothetical protein